MQRRVAPNFPAEMRSKQGFCAVNLAWLTEAQERVKIKGQAFSDLSYTHPFHRDLCRCIEDRLVRLAVSHYDLPLIRGNPLNKEQQTGSIANGVYIRARFTCALCNGSSRGDLLP